MLFKEIDRIGKFILRYRYGKAEGLLAVWENAIIEVTGFDIKELQVNYKRNDGSEGKERFGRYQDAWDLIPMELNGWDF